ncbi:MAG: tRNA-dihydrouridine synthase family protein [Lentisphaerae bacterium]|nr:tRNA-dihydrouridine synthase family protein [Lentisphaerota bacterium]
MSDQPLLPVYPENALIMAPLSGFTDLAYRRAAYRGGCRYAFTEMVDAASLAYANGNGEYLLKRGEEETFLAVQLVGADEELLKKASAKLNERDFSLLDFNLGCPVPKVVKKGAGAALGRNIAKALSCFAAIASESRFTLTAKMRILDELDPAPTLELCAGLVERGAKALTIHGRTREHFYTGQVSFDIIRAVREAFPDIPVIANGGVNSRESYDLIRRETGCSRVMLAQGIMGNPWLFSELSDNALPPTLEQWREMVHYHVSEMIALYGEVSAMRQARKIVHDYLKGRGFPASLRAEASTLASMSDLESLLARAETVSVSGTSRKISL